ncbi:MAG: GAF domain-containing protein, partial [Armatimonadota bacterium]|nr:GAF domain-containing protein [Armatimonadota bacterium]
MPNSDTNCDSSLADPDRLAALAATGLLDSPPEFAFDRLTRLACRILGTPVALVSLVTQDRQFFKSSAGLPDEVGRETPLSHSFCQHVVRSAQPLVVADAREEPNLRDNGAVRDLGVRAYAGVPLTTSDGQTLGSFCVIDTSPRDWTEDDLTTLRTLADSVQTEIELRGALRQAATQTRAAVYQAREADAARRETAALLEATAEGVYGINVEGACTFVNPAAARMLGVEVGELLGENLHKLIHHHRTDGSTYPESECPIYRTVQTGQSASVEDDVFFRPDGSAFAVDYCAEPLVEDGATVGAVISFSDITGRREAEALMRAALDKERHVAETLQHTILEDIPEDRFPGLSVASRYLAAWEEAQIGGDFYDAFALDGGKAAFVVGDASGKGLAAAIRTAEVK